MTAILKEEPQELTASNPNRFPALQRIVNRWISQRLPGQLRTWSQGF
jgi:hypothetical protein